MESHKLPPITTVQQAELPTPPGPDMKHKYDMAYKDGNRLIYDFEKVACDPGQVVGLDPLVADAIPWELEKEGIMEILDVMFDGESAKSLFPCWMSLNVLPDPG